MIPKFALAALLALAVFGPAENAAAQDPLGGAILGGAAGAIVGGAVGGGRGAAVGAIVGATTGAAIAAQGAATAGRILLLPERLLRAAARWRMGRRLAALLRNGGIRSSGGLRRT